MIPIVTNVAINLIGQKILSNVIKYKASIVVATVAAVVNKHGSTVVQKLKPRDKNQTKLEDF